MLVVELLGAVVPVRQIRIVAGRVTVILQSVSTGAVIDIFLLTAIEFTRRFQLVVSVVSQFVVLTVLMLIKVFLLFLPVTVNIGALVIYVVAFGLSQLIILILQVLVRVALVPVTVFTTIMLLQVVVVGCPAFPGVVVVLAVAVTLTDEVFAFIAVIKVILGARILIIVYVALLIALVGTIDGFLIVAVIVDDIVGLLLVAVIFAILAALVEVVGVIQVTLMLLVCLFPAVLIIIKGAALVIGVGFSCARQFIVIAVYVTLLCVGVGDRVAFTALIRVFPGAS